MFTFTVVAQGGVPGRLCCPDEAVCETAIVDAESTFSLCIVCVCVHSVTYVHHGSCLHVRMRRVLSVVRVSRGPAACHHTVDLGVPHDQFGLGLIRLGLVMMGLGVGTQMYIGLGTRLGIMAWSHSSCKPTFM